MVSTTAEAIAGSAQSRGGSNQGKLSSLARFLYYSDYLLGQFCGSARYRLRGYALLLYDRYYFRLHR